LDGADEAGVGLNAVLWIIQALSSAIKRNDPPPPHTGVSHCFFNLIAICALPGAQDSRDDLTSRRATV
jgi:hypothetical protein